VSELAKWDNFYVIVGSAAGALIGLQFVVLTLVSQRPMAGGAEAGAAFGNPTVVHFSVTLFISALLHAPWERITIAAAIWGLTGFVGVGYTVVVSRRLQRQVVYQPEFEDWVFHAALPMIAYATLALSSLASGTRLRESLFAVGGSALLLLFVGIHNAWDGVSYHVFVHRPKTEDGSSGDTK